MEAERIERTQRLITTGQGETEVVPGEWTVQSSDMQVFIISGPVFKHLYAEYSDDLQPR